MKGRTPIEWVMLVSGLLTLTVAQAAFAPQAALRASFGEALEGPLAEIVVRNWGALVGLMGALLVYGAFRPSARRLALLVAGTSKLVFVSLVLAHGTRFLGRPVALSIAIDSVMVLVFAAYLFATRDERPSPRGA
jgi:hypothetical protein